MQGVFQDRNPNFLKAVVSGPWSADESDSPDRGLPRKRFRQYPVVSDGLFVGGAREQNQNLVWETLEF